MQNPTGGKSALGLDANVAALLCYLPVCAVNLIMSIIVIVTDKENKITRFHAFQSLLLAALFIVLYIIVVVIVMAGAAANSSIFALFGSLLWFIVIIGFLGANIFGMIKGYQQQMFKFPIIGDMAEKWANG
ncbi:MAG: DUF4870 domain-containing protein [Pyrinomonadaceae bacterium]